MEIRRQLYEAYCEGILSVEPPPEAANNERKLKSLKEKIGVSGKDGEHFDNVLAELLIDAERNAFYAGVKIILRLLSE